MSKKMKCDAKTEADMRDHKAPSPKTLKELFEYIESLTEREHDYGTCVYAMSLAATAAFNHVAGKLGVTGFQASCADLDILRRTRYMEGPFIILKGEDLLFPQYDLRQQLDEFIAKQKEWLAGEAKKKLAEKDRGVHPEVAAHWRTLAA